MKKFNKWLFRIADVLHICTKCFHTGMVKQKSIDPASIEGDFETHVITISCQTCGNIYIQRTTYDMNYFNPLRHHG